MDRSRIALAWTFLCAAAIASGQTVGTIYHRQIDDLVNPGEIWGVDFVYKEESSDRDKVSAYKTVTRGTGTFYSLGWDHIGPVLRYSSEIAVAADSEIFVYKDNRPSRLDQHNGSVLELVSAIVPAEVLQKMARATVLRVQVRPGDPITVDAAGREALAAFVRDCVNTGPQFTPGPR